MFTLLPFMKFWCLVHILKALLKLNHFHKMLEVRPKKPWLKALNDYTEDLRGLFTKYNYGLLP